MENDHKNIQIIPWLEYIRFSLLQTMHGHKLELNIAAHDFC